MKFDKGKKYDVVAVAHAIVDVLAYVNQAFLDKHNLKKGTMSLIDEERAEYLTEHLRYIKHASGGSASNTIAGLASFGAKTALIGKVKDDEFGAIFKRDIGMAGVDFRGTTAKDCPRTATCFVAVSKEDAERTMSTYLGAAVDMVEEDIDTESIRNATILYYEGYLLDRDGSRKALMKAIEIAHKHKHIVSMSLSDKRCVEQHRESFMDLIQDVDLLFANEKEIKALFEVDDVNKAIEKASQFCSIVTVTCGPKGAIIVSKNEKHIVKATADPERIVDTTGAGDLYASGFLFGMIKGFDLKDCARLGNMAAAEIISHLGAKPEITLSNLIEKI